MQRWLLRPGGTAVIVDVVSSEDAGESNLQNAIERLRDPSHVRMLPASELHAGVARAGFRELEYTTWDKSREFEEWMQIVNDAPRAESVRTVVRALAEAGRTAGMGLCVKDAQVVFFHRWRLVKAVKPLGHSPKALLQTIGAEIRDSLTLRAPRALWLGLSIAVAR